MQPTENQIVDAMKTYGGSFASNIARAFRVADSNNYNRLRSAFPELWTDYTEMARAIIIRDTTKNN